MDSREKALKALIHYQSRLEMALASLKSGSWDEADLWLRKSRAAFHNFQVLDAQCTQRQSDQDPEFLDLHLKISVLIKTLNEELGFSLIRLQREESVLRAERTRLKNYQTLKTRDPEFAKSA